MPTTLIEGIRAAIAGTPHEFWPKIVAQHAQAGAWELCEALTVLRELQEPTPCGAPPQARWRLPPRTSTTAGLYAACAVFVGANGRAGRVADASVAMPTSAGRCAAAVTSG